MPEPAPHLHLQVSPSKMRGDIADRLAGAIVTNKAIEGRLEVKTGSRGRPQVYQRITVSSTSSDAASVSTVRRRSQELGTVGRTLTGGETGLRAQEAAGIKRLSIAEQESLLREIGLHHSATSPDIALTMKADLQLSYNKFRLLRVWLKSMGVELASERKMRSFTVTQVPQYSVKHIPMMKRSGDIVMAATIYLPDLISVVTFFLDKLKSADRLIWSNGIPEAEVWINVGGDHGGGTFKLSFQVRIYH